MPNVVCPNCGEIVLLDNSTYQWYEGPVTCRECHAVLSVKIGGWERPRPGETQGCPSVFPVPGANGGFLLEPPRLVEHRDNFPAILTLGLSSASIPVGVRQPIQQTVRVYATGNFADVVVRCRYTVEAALEDNGITPDSLGNMVTQAYNRKIIVRPVEALCRAVIAYGNRGAHPLGEPGEEDITWTDALTVIGMTANIVRSLYLNTEASR